mmetsp:Transcript_61532/g.145806  ORF Transcript_61532/g.145806 Transcript_61532/m.145806 type:complete len:208 (-) Transcript_61532:846-1469(-)
MGAALRVPTLPPPRALSDSGGHHRPHVTDHHKGALPCFDVSKPHRCVISQRHVGEGDRGRRLRTRGNPGFWAGGRCCGHCAGCRLHRRQVWKKGAADRRAPRRGGAVRGPRRDVRHSLLHPAVHDRLCLRDVHQHCGVLACGGPGADAPTRPGHRPDVLRIPAPADGAIAARRISLGALLGERRPLHLPHRRRNQPAAAGLRGAVRA